MLDKLSSPRCFECKEEITEKDKLCFYCGADLERQYSIVEKKILAEEYYDDALKTCNSGRSLEYALTDVELSIQFNPDVAEAHNLRGIILDLMSEKSAAILSYQEAIRINPDYSDAVDNLKEIEDEQFSEGIRDLDVFSNKKDSFIEETNAVTLSHQEAIRADCSAKDALQETKSEQLVRKADEFDAFSRQEDGFGIRFLKNIVWVVVLIAVILGANFAYREFGRNFILPKNTIVFQPDYSQVKNVTSEDLETTAQILSERAQALGYFNVSFVIDNEQIVGKMPNSLDVGIFAERISPVGLLEFVDFGETPISTGSLINTGFKSLQELDEKKWHTVMTNDYIEETSVVQDQVGGYQIAFSLTDDGSEIFAEYTGENIGTYLGIVLDKVVVSSPYIQSEITGGQGVITGQFTLDAAEDLAVILKTKALPFPIKYVDGFDTVE